MTKYSAGQLQQLWIGAGGPADKAVLMAAIGLAESREGDPNAINPGVGAGGRPTKEYSVGLWQINTLVHKNYSVEQLKNPQINAKEAVRIYKAQGLRAWGSYTDGRYRKYMPASQAAAGRSVAPIDPSGSSFLGQIGIGTVMVGFVVLFLVLDD